MRFRPLLVSLLAPLVLGAAIPTFSQVAPSATQGAGLPLAVGAGFSDYNIDWGGGRRENGGTVSAEWTFRQLPGLLRGLGVGAEGRDITINAPASLSFFQYQTGGGGVIYHYPLHSNVLPYAKVGEGFGRIKFLPGYPPTSYNSDTRKYFYLGGGADFHVWHHVWVRADYEYQIWERLFGSQHNLTPNGFTIGPEYDFGRGGKR